MDEFRRRYAKYTHYRIVPHITLMPPFILRSGTEGDLIASLRENFAGVPPGNVVFDAVRFFRNNNIVAYFAPDKLSQNYFQKLLTATRNSINGYSDKAFKDYKFTFGQFRPHMTIAEKIPPEIYPRVKRELSELDFCLKFPVDSVTVFCLNQEKSWEKIAEIPFVLESG